jgi:hypothetical protein
MSIDTLLVGFSIDLITAVLEKPAQARQILKALKDSGTVETKDSGFTAARKPRARKLNAKNTIVVQDLADVYRNRALKAWETRRRNGN